MVADAPAREGGPETDRGRQAIGKYGQVPAVRPCSVHVPGAGHRPGGRSAGVAPHRQLPFLRGGAHLAVPGGARSRPPPLPGAAGTSAGAAHGRAPRSARRGPDRGTPHLAIAGRGAARPAPPQHKEAPLLVRCARFGGVDAARHPGVPPGTAKSRCHYAVRALKCALTNRGVLAPGAWPVPGQLRGVRTAGPSAVPAVSRASRDTPPRLPVPGPSPDAPTIRV